MWSGAAAWIDGLAAAVRTPEGEELRAAAHVHVETMLDVAAADARAADSRTGRGVATAHATVAKALGCSSKTVQRARTLIEALGYAVTVVAGRYLTREERAEANAAHGGDQRRMASERALVVPRPMKDVHLPRGGSGTGNPLERSGLPKRALTRAAAASRHARTRTTPRRAHDRPPIEVQRLAAKLARRLPWLARGHIGSLCRTLMLLGVDETGWTAQDVTDLLDRRNVDLGLYSIPSGSQRAPLALFAHQLRAALLDVDEAPQHRRRREAAARAAQRERDRAERAEAAAQIEAERNDPAIQARIAAIRAEMRAQLARGRQAAKYRR